MSLVPQLDLVVLVAAAMVVLRRTPQAYQEPQEEVAVQVEVLEPHHLDKVVQAALAL